MATRAAILKKRQSWFLKGRKFKMGAMPFESPKTRIFFLLKSIYWAGNHCSNKFLPTLLRKSFFWVKIPFLAIL